MSGSGAFMTVLRACLWLLTSLLTGLAPSAAVAAAPASGVSTSYYVDLQPDGQPPVRVHAEEAGGGPPVLLLHGLGASTYTWRHVAPRLAARNRVIALDLRGFGRSDKPFDQYYAPADHAAVVRAFIKARQLSQVTLVGHSYGGMLALMLALDRRLEPHRIARLVVMNAPAFPQPFSAGVRFLRKPLLPYVALLLAPEVTTTVSFMMEQVGFERLTDQDISIYAGPLSEPGGPYALIETASRIVPANLPRLMARYPAMVKPTLVVWCREDSVVPLASGERLAATLPRARLVVLEGCDHVPSEQVPGPLGTALRRFLDR
jgi:pimeloyl-ACP methyl ester carboxylesterase